MARRAAMETEQLGLTLHPLLWCVPVSLGKVLTALGDLDNAEVVLSTGLEHRLPTLRSHPLAYALALLALAPVRFGLGHAQAAGRLVEDARSSLAACGDPGMLPALLAETVETMATRARRTTGLLQD